MRREISCHAANLFFEARGESFLGQRWVMDVVANRVASSSYPDSYCGVITQPAQFTWYLERPFDFPTDPLDWEEYIYEYYSKDTQELLAWYNSLTVAMNHYFYRDRDYSNGSMWYMTMNVFVNERLSTPWNRTEISNTIGNHVFFKPCHRTNKKCYRF